MGDREKGKRKLEERMEKASVTYIEQQLWEGENIQRTRGRPREIHCCSMKTYFHGPTDCAETVTSVTS